MKKVFLLASVAILALSCNKDLPQSWAESWQNPPMSCRPLKIQHGIPDNPEELLTFYRDSCGFGGVVVNYTFGPTYLQVEEDWIKFGKNIEKVDSAGLRIWIYDEMGYPSIGAGGRVLEADPSVESLEIVYDQAQNKYWTRPSYEYTHACNNYHCLRRIPDPGSEKAVKLFTEVTHDRYKKYIKDFSVVEAFFTDEPSYMGINLGPIPEKVRQRVPVKDEPDYNKPLLPMAVTSPGVAQEYQERFGEPLDTASLFKGDTDKDKMVRQRYWTIMGDRFANNYCGTLQKWCSNAGTISSGHFLREEKPECHVGLYGNYIDVQRGLDIPGLDMLDTDPCSWNTGDALQWLIAAYPVSAAVIDGKRLVMSEVSDHNQSVLWERPANLQEMLGTAACHLAEGVTELTLYYGANRPGMKLYSEFVGRINSIVRDADMVKKVLLYYPAIELQREYIPTREAVFSPNDIGGKYPEIVNGFINAGWAMTKAHIPFVIADSHALGDVNPADFDVLVIPAGTQEDLPEVKEALGRFNCPKVYANLDCTTADMIEAIKPVEQFAPARESISYGKFTREGHTIYVVTNCAQDNYEGTLTVGKSGKWAVLDPETGEFSERCTSNGGVLPVNLGPIKTRLYISL